MSYRKVLATSFFPLSGILNKVANSPLSFNSLAILILRGTTISVRLVILFLIARFATPAEFGRAAFAIAVAEIAKVIADLGLDTLSIREFAIMPAGERQQYFATTVASAKFFCGIIVYILSLFYFNVIKNQIDIEAISGLLILTSLWSNLSIDYFQAKLKMNKICWPVFINGLATVVVALIIFLLKPSLIAGIAILIVSESISTLILLRLFSHEVKLLKQGINFFEIYSVLKKSLPIAVTGICVILYTRLDVVVISHYFDAATVGYYGVAFRMTEPFQFIAAALSMSIYSHIAASLADGHQSISKLARHYLFGTLSFGLISCISLTLLAPVIIKQFLPDYVSSIPILQVLAFALIFRTLNSYLTSLIQAHGHFTRITAVAVWNLVLIAMILLVCVPRFGAVGAAVALLIGEIINSLIQIFIVKSIILQQRSKYN